MTTRIHQSLAGPAIVCSLWAFMLQSAKGAEFTYILLGDSFQQEWPLPKYWTLEDGVDDGGNGYPDGTDTLTMDRSGTDSAATRLAIEAGPLMGVGGITGKGGPGRDIVLKHAPIFVLGYLEVLESENSFLIQSERDKDFDITGVISGAGDLELHRLGGFSDGVQEGEETSFKGTEPNTITGSIRLYNDSGSGQPAYWVADKVGAFGQAAELRVEGRAVSSGVSSLRITANAVGGEGAIDDNATTVYIGAEGVLNVDAGVDEKVGEGKLFLDLEGTGTFTEVEAGTYDNSESWITGEGTFTVGVPMDLAVTEISYSNDGGVSQVSLTWTSSPGRSYVVKYSTDMIDWSADLDDGVIGDDGATTTREFDLSGFPGLTGESTVFFRIEEG